MEKIYESILDYGADKSGSADSAQAFERAFAHGKLALFIPEGEYRIDRTVIIPSGAVIEADGRARIFAAPGSSTAGSVFTNSDHENGNSDITIRGGLWDGRCDVNRRASYCDPDYAGLFFDFVNVNGLTLENIRMRNAVCYHIRMGEVKNFKLDKIRFEGELTPLCQDGIHIGGGCEYGSISNVYARPGGMGDDLIALNADDVFWYSHSVGMKALPIRHISIENVIAEDCYTGVRLLSINTEISDISFRNMKIGFRAHGLNLDAARHCGDPIFKPEDYPRGVGNMHDITFENIQIWSTSKNRVRDVVTFETNVKRVRFRNFVRMRECENADVSGATFRFACMNDTTFNDSGEITKIPCGETFVSDRDVYESIEITTIGQ